MEKMSVIHSRSYCRKQPGVWRYVFVMLMMLSAAGAYAQVTVSGRVVDREGRPLPFAQVSAKAVKDSTAEALAVADNAGEFSIQCKSLPAVVKAEYMGYRPKTMELTSDDRMEIILEEDSVSLAGVVVKGNMPKLRLSREGLMAQVAGTPLARLGTADDILHHIPMLRKTHDGYTVFGKGTPVIFINGKQMRDDNELKQLKSDDVKSVEIITNPGAGYDASVNAVLKIKTVRPADEGFNADVTLKAGQGRKDRYDRNASATISHRKGGLDIFGNLWYSHTGDLQHADMDLSSFGNGSFHETSVMDIAAQKRNAHLTAGTDYALNDSNSIGVKYTFYLPLHDKESTTLDNRLFKDGTPYDVLHNSTDSKTDNRCGHTLNAYYSGKVGKVSIEANADYLGSGYDEHNAIREQSDVEDSRTLSTCNKVRNDFAAAKVVVSVPLWKGILDLGTEDSYTHRTDLFDNPEQYVASADNRYNKYCLAAFADYALALPFGQLTGGLRFEHFDYKYSGDEDIRKCYNNVFPSASFTTGWKNIRIMAAYSSKTVRPSYRQLSNDVFYASMYSLQRGNPLLANTTLHDVSLMAAWEWVQLILDYTHYHDAIINFDYQQDGDVTVTSYRNLPSLNTFTPALILAPAFGIWQPQLSVAIQQQWLGDETVTGGRRLRKPLVLVGFRNTADFGKGWLAELNFNYQSKGDYQNAHLSKNTYGLDISLSKSFFDNRLDVKLEGLDLLNRTGDGSTLYSPGVTLSQINRYYNREIMLTVHWRFKERPSKYKGSGAGQDERNALK